MKLTTKFVGIYLIITLIVLAVGGYISYFIIQDELNQELKWRFLGRVERVTDLLEQGKQFRAESLDDQDGRNLVVRKLERQVEPDVSITDTLVWHGRLQQMEPNLKMTAYRTVQDTSYYISTYGALVETDDITDVVTEILLWLLLMQIIGAIGVGFLVSGRLFKPFRKTLGRIKNFSLQDKEPIEAEQTNVQEFDDLNKFVEGMTRKAIRDYENVKEFAENASHEIKTPLAIVQGKLELLEDTDLNQVQHEYVEASHRSIKKLSKLSTSLGLLTKIENQEFEHKEPVNFSVVIEDSLQAFRELVALNGVEVSSDITPKVMVQMHPVLADVLWTNSFQNAIKHNTPKGIIDIKLTEEKLVVKNTGPAPPTEPEELFKRFRKSDPNSNSIGLGLSIVKRIATRSGFTISYRYTDDALHKITLWFKQNI